MKVGHWVGPNFIPEKSVMEFGGLLSESSSADGTCARGVVFPSLRPFPAPGIPSGTASPEVEPLSFSTR